MNYAVRNTLIITGFWAVLIVAGIYLVFGHQVRIHSRLLKEKTAKSKKLGELQYLDETRIEVEEYLMRLIEVDEGVRGIIVSSETPGETFDYIVRELDRSNSSIQFDLKSKSTSAQPKFTTSNYEIVGEGTFLESYKLFWFLENGPAFYRIEGFQLRRLEEDEFVDGYIASNAEVAFSIRLISYQREGRPSIKTLNLEEDLSKNLANLFEPTTYSRPRPSNTATTTTRRNTSTPRITTPSPNYSVQSIPRANTTGLPEITRTTKLLAVTPEWVLVETQTGQTMKLRKGQKIYGGYLSEIRTNSNQVVFEVNQGSGPQNIVLSVSYKNTRM